MGYANGVEGAVGSSDPNPKNSSTSNDVAIAAEKERDRLAREAIRRKALRSVFLMEQGLQRVSGRHISLMPDDIQIPTSVQ
ncbi:MAG: hypothetical protein Q7R54_03705 [bacterium]|nr:hypothetical protein [bacterium]